MRSQNFALFDPRQMNRMWPEPNDDPNIPYVWGLSGYGRTRRNDARIECSAVIDLDSIESPEEKLNFLMARVDSRSPIAMEIRSLGDIAASRLLTQDDFNPIYGKLLCLEAAANDLRNLPAEQARRVGEAKAQILDRELDLAEQFNDLAIAPTSDLLAANILAIYRRGFESFEMEEAEITADLDALEVYLENFLSKSPSEVRYLGAPPNTTTLAELTTLVVNAANRIAQNYPDYASHPIFQRIEFVIPASPRSQIKPLGAAMLATVGVGAIVGLFRGLGKGERGLDLAKSVMLGATVVGLLKGEA